VRQGKRIAGHEILTVLSQRNTGFPLEGASAILEDKSGLFWIVSDSRLYRCERTAHSWLISPSNFNRSLYAVEGIGQTSDGTLWVSGMSQGIGFSGFAFSFNGTRFGSLADTISSVSEGPVSEDTLKDSYFAFPGREGREWFAFSGPAHRKPQLVSYDGSRWSLPIAVPRGFVMLGSGLEDSQGSIWLSFGEIWKFDRQQLKWEQIGPKGVGQTLETVRRIYEDREGRMWFATSWGDVASCDKDGGWWRSFKIGDHVPPRATKPSKLLAGLPPIPFAAEDICQDSRGKMLFATRRGLLALNSVGSNWEFFDRGNSGLPGSAISLTFQDRSGRIWLGTNEGIVILNE